MSQDRPETAAVVDFIFFADFGNDLMVTGKGVIYNE